jgi:hypothetical protein
MNNAPPISEGGLSIGWANWFNQVFACLPWKKGFTVSADLDFPSVAAQSQQALTAVVKGARPGDAAMVAPSADVTGVIFAAVVTAADTVTVYAKNFTTGAVNPASQSFRIIVIQN